MNCTKHAESRDIRFDIARALCMFYIVAILHLSQYLGEPYYIYETYVGRILTFSCLGLFTFMSGYLIGKKYRFEGTFFSIETISFYKKRILRFYPLFVLATIILWLIKFNSLKASVWGLIGAAPFVDSQPKTLWYISMLMFFYLITPVLNRNGLVWKISLSCFLLCVSCIMKLYIQLDTRFIFNLFFYCLGIMGASKEIILKFPNRITRRIAIAVFATVLILANLFCSRNVGIMLFLEGIGVFILFFWAVDISNIKNVHFRNVIYVTSYGSMVLYLFHRFYYWCGEQLYNPNDAFTKSLYFLIIIFPIGLGISYYTQKGYNKIANRNG